LETYFIVLSLPAVMKDEGHRNAAPLRSFAAAQGEYARGLGAGANRRDGLSARGSSYGPTGHESIAQASAWVLHI
jgi:hypothetical protein